MFASWAGRNAPPWPLLPAVSQALAQHSQAGGRSRSASSIDSPISSPGKQPPPPGVHRDSSSLAQLPTSSVAPRRGVPLLPCSASALSSHSGSTSNASSCDPGCSCSSRTFFLQRGITGTPICSGKQLETPPYTHTHTQDLWDKERDRGSLDHSGFLILTQQSYTHVHTNIQLHICTFTHAGTYIHIFAHTHTHALTHIQTHIHSPSLGCDDLGLQNPEQFLVTLDTGPRLVRPHYRAPRATTALRSP